MTSLANKPIILYDIPSKGRCACWSPNVWKTRLVLNFKNIPYKTEWLEYPEIEPKLKALDVPPNPPDSWADYTCPVVQLPNGEFVVDSWEINQRLEALYPEPSLQLELGLHQQIRPALGKAVNPIGPTIIAAVWRNVLREPSASWFAEDRRIRLGMTLDQYEAEKGGDSAWPAVWEGLESLKLEMSRHRRDDGPFLLGSTVSYGDFLIAAGLTWLEMADKTVYQKFVGYDKCFEELHEACRPWLKRDEH